MQPKIVTMLPSTALLGHADGGPNAAEPPYHVRTVDFMFVLSEYDPDAARRSLPPALQPERDEPGFLALYSAPSGWGITPYTAFFAAVPVQGFDSPDGSRGYMMVEGFYSGRAGPIMHEHYNRRLVPGHSRQWNDGKNWYGEAGPGETSVVDIRLTPLLPRPDTPLAAGVHHYLGERGDGDLNIYSVAYSGEFYPVEDVEIEFSPSASPLLQSLQPVAIPYASLLTEAPLTFSPPRPVSVSAAEMATESARLSLLDVLARLGRPAALVARSGRVIFLNGEGEALLGGVVDKGHLRTWRRREQRDLDRVVETAVEAGPAALSEPIALGTMDRDRPVLAQAIPVSPALAGEPAALILFSDPTGLGTTDPTAALELLGLTRAEARIAAQVGNGMSARGAADVLAITENTVRSTLKLIYGKLGIGKQSELARILARLDGFGTPTRRTRNLEGEAAQF